MKNLEFQTSDTVFPEPPVPFLDYDPIMRDLEYWQGKGRVRPVWQGD